METASVRYEPAPDDPYAPSATPIYQTATFRLDRGGEFDYTRSGNPTRKVLEGQLARAEQGCRASAFSSGMAAIQAALSLVGVGDEVVALTDLYGGTYRYLRHIVSRQGIRVRFDDAEPTGSPALVLVETPTNPLQRVSDLRALASRIHELGGLLAVDNSLMSPYLQRPLECGADLVIHSATKFLSGHGDVTAGCVVTRDRELSERIAFYQNATGTGLAPFEAWLLARGMKTLCLRLERQQKTAGVIAQHLRKHPLVKRVYYPGLRQHPGRRVHFGQASGAGSVLAFETGSLETSRSFIDHLSLFSVTVSFGSVESTVSLPSSMSHASIEPEVRKIRGFPEDLVRMSLGIEHTEDLLEDVERALRMSAT